MLENKQRTFTSSNNNIPDFSLARVYALKKNIKLTFKFTTETQSAKFGYLIDL